jgi:Uma2 family endonuclease
LQIFPDRPNRIPRADAGFVSYQRLAQGPLPGGHLQVPPELAIEVISPRDEMEYVHRKIREYLGAGVNLVWVILPEARTAEVYRRDGTVTYIQPDGALDGEDVLPGFHCPLAGVMPLLGPTPPRRPRR